MKAGFLLLEPYRKGRKMRESFTFNVFFYVFVIMCVLFLFDLIDIEMIIVWLLIPGIMFWVAIAVIVAIIKSIFN